MARFRRKMTMGKVPVQHAGTVMSNAGFAQTPGSMVVLLTEAGARNVTGANQDITADRDTGSKCNVGDVVKFINLFIQCGPRIAATSVDEEDRTGWLEWAFVCCKETETLTPITTMGAQTLGVVCNNMYRNECLYSGAMPVGGSQPNAVSITLKIPKTKQIIRIGDQWRFITFFRPVDSASDRSDAVRLVRSFMYKGYQ